MMKSNTDKENVNELVETSTLKKEWVKPVLKTLSLNATLAGESATSNDAMSRSGS